MTTPKITEIPQRLEPVTHDPFIDDLTALSVPLVAAGASGSRGQERAGSRA
jgi:hypothetical protein